MRFNRTKSSFGDGVLEITRHDAVTLEGRHNTAHGIPGGFKPSPTNGRTELERVRKQQIAYSIEEWLPGQCALAIPVFFEGKLEVTLGVQLPLKRYLLERQGLRKVLLSV